MKFKTLMIVKAIICLGFAPVMLFFPVCPIRSLHEPLQEAAPGV